MTPPTDEKEKKKVEEAFSSFADDLASVEEEDLKAKKEILKEGIERIESEDSDKVNASRMITAQLSKLREKADLSPFVGTSGRIKSPRFRRNEFIELLARELLYIGREELQDSGGIISMNKLLDHFAEIRDNWELRDKDIPEAIEWLVDEELIPAVENIGEDNKLIRFKPIELSTDTKRVLETATGIDATRSKLLSALGWDEARLDIALDQLETDGIIIIDGENIYFPGL